LAKKQPGCSAACQLSVHQLSYNSYVVLCHLTLEFVTWLNSALNAAPTMPTYIDNGMINNCFGWRRWTKVATRLRPICQQNQQLY